MTQTVILMSFQGLMIPLHCEVYTGSISLLEAERSHQIRLRLRWTGIELCEYTTIRSELSRTRLVRQGSTSSQTSHLMISNSAKTAISLLCLEQFLQPSTQALASSFPEAPEFTDVSIGRKASALHQFSGVAYTKPVYTCVVLDAALD